MADKDKQLIVKENNGHKPVQAISRTTNVRDKSAADEFLFDIPEDKIHQRSDLTNQDIVLMSSEVMRERALDSTRDPKKEPLTRVKRKFKLEARLSLNRQSREEAVGVLQAQQEQQAANEAMI